MAVRLPVVIAQHNLRSGNFADLEESLVAELIFANGLDVSLVQSLERIDLSSTDHLCLEGFMGDFACLSWSTPEESAVELRRLGISGSLSARDQSESARIVPISESGEGKRVIHFDLRQWESAPQLMQKLNQILADRNVQIIPIRIGLGNGGASKSGTSVKPEAKSPPLHPPTLPHIDVPVKAPALQSQEIPTRIELDDDEDWPHLDRLVDDLDASLL